MRKTWLPIKWTEKWFGEYTFYMGSFSKGDLRFGISLGNEEGQLNLGIITFGYMK